MGFRKTEQSDNLHQIRVSERKRNNLTMSVYYTSITQIDYSCFAKTYRIA